MLPRDGDRRRSLRPRTSELSCGQTPLANLYDTTRVSPSTGMSFAFTLVTATRTPLGRYGLYPVGFQTEQVFFRWQEIHRGSKSPLPAQCFSLERNLDRGISRLQRRVTDHDGRRLRSWRRNHDRH